MEPTIYKPGAYNTPGVYKGSGGIYKGRGVYNDGAGEFVEIGGKSYPVVTIGSQKWIAYNLDYAWSGLDVGTNIDTTIPHANYYNNDNGIFGWNGRKCGLLYNYAALVYLENNKADLIPGWRVPTLTDYQNLSSELGGDSVSGLKLKYGNLDWASDWGGDNESGFSGLPCGYCWWQNGGFNSMSLYANFGTITQYSTTHYYVMSLSKNNSVTYGGGEKTAEYSLRLVKD